MTDLKDYNLEEQKILECIKLPDKKDGFRYALLLGTSGAGKTSLLRQICGTAEYGFPSTSTCRTTTCKQEIICGDFKEYEAVVSFMPKELFSQYITECIEEACRLCIESERDGRPVSDKEIAGKLFNHRDLIIRLSYLLGEYKEEGEQSEFDAFDELDETYTAASDEMQQTFKNYIDRVRGISAEFDANGYEDKKDQAISLLCEDIVAEVQKKFSLLTGGEVVCNTGQWVNGYYIKSDDRKAFLDQMKKFSGNSRREWGKLLSPLVRTIRIRGDFRPKFCDKAIQFVIYDGVGLGHTAAMSSIPTEVTEKYTDMDVILLVDDATKPVMHSTKLALMDVIGHGCAKKLLLCFTHLDRMEGENFDGTQSKVDSINDALSSYLSDLGEKNQDALSNQEKRQILSLCFYFSELNSKNISELSRAQLIKAADTIRKRYEETIPVEEVRIWYDAMTLYHHLQNAIEQFHTEWEEKLGIPSDTGKKEHWTRIRALTRRLARLNEDNYNQELQPLADLARCIKEELNIYLNKPVKTSVSDVSDPKVIAKRDCLKGQINDAFLEFIRHELWKNDTIMEKWEEAYSSSGKGSAGVRAKDVNAIFDLGAPRFKDYIYDMNENQKRYIKEAMGIVQTALEENDCVLLRFE